MLRANLFENVYVYMDYYGRWARAVAFGGSTLQYIPLGHTSNSRGLALWSMSMVEGRACSPKCPGS